MLRLIVLGINICVLTFLFHTCNSEELAKFTTCNQEVDMEQMALHQGALELTISDWMSSSTRVSCDFTIRAGNGRQVMFYFTDMNLGAPNRTQRVDKACIEPRDVTGSYEAVLTGMRALVCSRTEVELGSKVYATTGSALKIRFFRNRGFSISVYFKIVFTSFRSGSCRTSERRCRNERCIAHEIVCNEHNPCGDYSDCPTGLEHLSSWALSGIVVLALLSGGIIIIMATVCLQRASSKRYDFDDILIPANGSLRHETPNVEMNDVTKKPKSSSDENHIIIDAKEKHYVTTTEADDKLIIRDYDPSMHGPPTASDREKLIKVNGRCSEPTGHFEHIQFEPSPHQFVDITERQISNADILRQARFTEEFGSFGQHSFLVPEDISKSSSGLGTCKHDAVFTDRSLVYSDSESEGDDMFKAASLDRRRNHESELKTSNSHDGALSNNHRHIHVFADFKPPPPPYDSCTNSTTSIDITTNKVTVR